MWRKCRAGLVVAVVLPLMLLSSSPADARTMPPAILDPAFGAGVEPGIIATGLGDSAASMSATTQVFSRPDDSVVLAGSTSAGTNSEDYWLGRLRPNGSIDQAFGTNGLVVGNVHTVGVRAAVDSSGRIVAVTNTTTAIAVHRFTAGGAVDTSFGGGTGTLEIPLSAAVTGDVALDSQGRVYLQVQDNLGPGAASAVYRLTAAGVLDSSYGSGGRLQLSMSPQYGPGRLDMLTGDRLVVLYYEPSTWFLTRLLASGIVDPTFAPSSSGVVQLALGGTQLTVLADGRMIVAGGLYVQAFDSIGTPLTFGSMGGFLILTGRPIQAVTPVGSGGFYTMQVRTDPAGPQDIEVRRYDASGFLDPVFNPTGPTPGTVIFSAGGLRDSYAAGLTTDYAGRLLIGGGRLLKGPFVARLLPGAPPPQAIPVVPERLLDTRVDGPQVGFSGPKPVAGATIELQVTGAGVTDVPSDATAAVLNVTATEPVGDGYVTVWPCGTSRPLASNLNLHAGGTTANLVAVKLGAGGKVCLYTMTSTHLIADITGYG